MNASLEKLVSHLAKEGDGKFHVLKRYINESKVPLLLRKGVYPYDYMDVEEGIRGGISTISNRYSKANNPYVPGYYSTQNKNYIIYLDTNNLCGWAMSQPLTTHDFF